MIGIALNSQWKLDSNKPKTHLQFVLCHRIRLLLLPFGYTNFPWLSRLWLTTLFPCYLEEIFQTTREMKDPSVIVGWISEKKEKRNEGQWLGSSQFQNSVLFEIVTTKMRQELILKKKERFHCLILRHFNTCWII